MSTGKPDKPDDRLDAYLDGALDGQAQHEMRERVAREPDLQREVQLQSRIDEALRRCCQAPDVEALLQKAGKASATTPKQSGTLRRIARMAAVILLCVSGVLAAAWFFGPSGKTSDSRSYLILGVEGSYTKMVANGFTPDWRCETDQQFAETYQTHLGQPLLLGPLPDGVEALGLSYSPAFSHNTVALLARVDGEPVVVYADRAELVSGPAAEFTGPGAHVFERRVGDLVLCEVTTRDSPALLGAMFVPDNIPECDPDQIVNDPDNP